MHSSYGPREYRKHSLIDRFQSKRISNKILRFRLDSYIQRIIFNARTDLVYISFAKQLFPKCSSSVHKLQFLKIPWYFLCKTKANLSTPVHIFFYLGLNSALFLFTSCNGLILRIFIVGSFIIPDFTSLGINDLFHFFLEKHYIALAYGSILNIILLPLLNLPNFFLFLVSFIILAFFMLYLLYNVYLLCSLIYLINQF